MIIHPLHRNRIARRLSTGVQEGQSPWAIIREIPVPPEAGSSSHGTVLDGSVLELAQQKKFIL